ncbi:MAG: Lrp/AsnC family transcriptional regulator [Pseudomonadota bacterium]|nr:Lrp/AsnC family transcriptional regulator [Pseudomonadota bacterium]
MSESHEIDQLDRKIMDLLQRDATLTNQEIADRIGLSPAPCSRRIKQLVEHGFIKRQIAILDRRKLNLNLVAIVGLGLEYHTAEQFAEFEKLIAEIPEVVECYVVTGQKADYILKVVVPDMDRYEQVLLKQITTIKGVSSVHTSFQLRDVFENRPLPLEYSQTS